MRHTLIGCTLCLSACWLSDAEILDRYDPGSVDPDTSVSDVMTEAVLSVEPDFGTNAGEQTVVIEVDVLGANPEVTFGGEVAELVSTEGTTLTVRTPRGAEGATDVAVSSGGGVGTLEDGYWYWSDDAGAFGTIGAVTYYDYTGDLERLGAMEEYDYEDETTVDIRFVSGAFDDYAAGFSTSIDTCRLGARSMDMTELDLQSPDIQLQAPGGSARSIVYDSEASAYKSVLPASSSSAGATYDMLPFQGTGAFPAFGIDRMADLPGPFTVLAPDFEEPRPFSNDLGESVESGTFYVEWSRPDDADYVILELERWGPNASNTRWEVREVALCVVADDGEFHVPSTLWTGWYPSAPIDVYVSRVRTSESVLPHNNSVNGVVGRSLVAGTVWQGFF